MGSYRIPGVKTFEYTKIIGLEHIEFGHDIIIDDFVLIYAKDTTKIGDYAHIAAFSSITGGGTFEMGRFTGLASGARIITGTDDFKDWGFGGPPIHEKYRNVQRGHISLGTFCIVGANSVILPNVTIGEGTCVGAGSVVTRDLAPWGIYIGNKRVNERNKAAVLQNYEQFLLDTGG
jgi:galactoside O-acetyltransferase